MTARTPRREAGGIVLAATVLSSVAQHPGLPFLAAVPVGPLLHRRRGVPGTTVASLR